MRIGWRAALGFTVSALLLWWALRDVSLSVVARELGRANLALLALSAGLSTAIFALRAVRWQVILQPLGVSVAFAPAWRAINIGMMVNNVIPARAGELARAYALTRESPGVPFAGAVASLAVDRVFDALAVLLLATLALTDPALTASATVGGSSLLALGLVGTGVVAALFVALYAVVTFPDALIRVWEIVVRRLSPRLEERGKVALHAFSAGLGALRCPRRFSLVFAWTLAHWVVMAAAFWIAFYAVGIDLPITAALLVQAVIAFGVAIPSAPGFFGVFEAVAIVALGLYGVDRTTATTFAIGFHLFSFVPVTLLGAYYATRLGLRLRDLEAPPQSSG